MRLNGLRASWFYSRATMVLVLYLNRSKSLSAFSEYIWIIWFGTFSSVRRQNACWDVYPQLHILPLEWWRWETKFKCYSRCFSTVSRFWIWCEVVLFIFLFFCLLLFCHINHHHSLAEFRNENLCFNVFYASRIYSPENKLHPVREKWTRSEWESLRQCCFRYVEYVFIVWLCILFNLVLILLQSECFEFFFKCLTT